MHKNKTNEIPFVKRLEASSDYQIKNISHIKNQRHCMFYNCYTDIMQALSGKIFMSLTSAMFVSIITDFVLGGFEHV